MSVSLDHLVRRQTRQGTMWSEAIILFLKQLDFFFRILERKEPVDVQALIAKAAVEGFNERIIRWFSGPREVQRHLVVISPLVQRLRDELASVVDLNPFWHYAAQRFDPFHHGDYVDAFQVLAHLDLQTFATIIID